MRRRVYEKRMRSILDEPFKSLGFLRHGEVHYIKEEEEVEEIIVLAGRVDRFSGDYVYNFWAHIRFKAIFHFLGSGNDKDNHSVIGTPLHLLHKDHHFFEWPLFPEEPDNIIREKVMTEIRTYALPFFDKNRVWDNVKTQLISPNDRDDFVISITGSICMLALMEYIDGNKVAAVDLIEAALKKTLRWSAEEWQLQKVQKILLEKQRENEYA